MDGSWRYWLDLQGFVHLPQALSPSELASAQAAAQRLIDGGREGSLPPGWTAPQGSGFYRDVRILPAPSPPPPPMVLPASVWRAAQAFAWDRALERLCFHPASWPLILELTGGKPQLRRGTMIHDHATDNPAAGGLMHSAREGPDFEDIIGKKSVHFSGSDEEGFLRCSNFLCFWNLDDVSPDDGGLLLVPGSHKVARQDLNHFELSSPNGKSACV